ncbi:putative protein tyrosine phosphatase (Pyp1) [Aspergillus saccharolyticus JOP 1030-1]|uniref:Uncharacterized protein n=1 Tax=Aspergillus saccharolyticus JOP 1030-1 TaxID=1450539 RepID=A0A318ZKE8_9EURO|nr:hypothetical protein BP01DRAFT_372582 [Aspergillus saccharolyticus JOP 1030-1]PYH47265.1 hypothetical protein BP01DRAFT_372582 [Aspergillus saccharolyticus JOP 1030-1]
MSAMTGSRSPTSPWPSDCQNLQLDNPPSPTSFFSFCDTQTSTHGAPGLTSSNTILERSGPDHFSISLENGNIQETVPHTQSAGSYPKIHLPDTRPLEHNWSFPTSGLMFNSHSKEPAGCGSWNRNIVSQGANAHSGQSSSMEGRPISTDECAALLGSSDRNVMLLDVRPYAHFAKGTINGSLNLCIPTTLLKRPSFDTQKLANTFTADHDKKKFAQWRQTHYIIVFDAATSDMKDAGPLANVLKKFTSEGWGGEPRILLGGYKTFSSQFPHLIKQPQLSAPGVTTKKKPKMHIDLPSAAPVAGGCALPESSHAAIPFFANIRQHMDLVDGVGQIPIQLPPGFTELGRQKLPVWLRDVSEASDKGRKVSERFLGLEKRELARMKRALSYDKSDTSAAIDSSSEKYRVAGIEKGTKNRYNDIYPFEHSRVRLQNVSPGGCDYVNGNHLKAEKSGKCYIATQAPVPDTFNDFWRVIWEQDVRLIVSLTAEVERGQVKCHPYWKSGDYGQCQVNNFSQKLIYLNSRDSPHINLEGSQLPPDVKDDPGNPYIIVRHFGLHASQQLYGARFRSDCVTFQSDISSINVKASVLASTGTSALALVFREQECIKLFHIVEGGLRPQAHLELQWCRPGAVEILKTSFDGDDTLYVLHRFKPSLEDSDCYARHTFVRHAMQSGTDTTVYLSRYSLASLYGTVRICAFPDHANYEPLALAAARGGIFAISWQHNQDTSDIEVILYISSSESDCEIRPEVIGLQSRLARGLPPYDNSSVVGLRFNDKSSQLLYCYRGQTLYGSFQRVDMSSFPIQPTLYENSCPVQFTDSLCLLFSIEVPFFGTHETQFLDGFARCQWKYLSFGLATHREEQWTVACLLKSETFCRAQNCQHVLQLERGRRLPDWTVVARLWGFQPSTNSLGCIVAASRQGTRLAVANWKTVYVWAIEPNVLIEENSNGYYPLASQAPDSSMIELRPIALTLEAVCFQLQFAQEENGLIALTDKGVMCWDLSSRGRGRRLVQHI